MNDLLIHELAALSASRRSDTGNGCADAFGRPVRRTAPLIPAAEIRFRARRAATPKET
jgi:hypothetical protein